ncbi:hypothetical protein EZS27_017400 [termite gut metagenome]|uniref:HEPN domain-containing protein n=1 Tax=termite gut metagenome TaxID=433724 RepID=A0A5J4RMD6_9ZZZZ
MKEDTEYDDFSVETLFEEDYHDAKAYHRRALQFLDEGQRASLVFNVASVALERYLVAICDLYGVEPMNHNFISLMSTVDKLVPVSQALNKGIKSLDRIFGICFLEDYYHGTPTTSDADKALQLCNEVGQMFDPSKITSVRTMLQQRKKTKEVIEYM